MIDIPFPPITELKKAGDYFPYTPVLKRYLAVMQPGDRVVIATGGVELLTDIAKIFKTESLLPKSLYKPNRATFWMTVMDVDQDLKSFSAKMKSSYDSSPLIPEGTILQAVPFHAVVSVDRPVHAYGFNSLKNKAAKWAEEEAERVAQEKKQAAELRTLASNYREAGRVFRKSGFAALKQYLIEKGMPLDVLQDFEGVINT